LVSINCHRARKIKRFPSVKRRIEEHTQSKCGKRRALSIVRV
jgi:hypothetical protein